MNIQPNGKRILVEITKNPRATASGLEIAEGADKDKVFEVRIAAVGSECEDKFKVGQTVLIANWAGDEVKREDKMFKIMDSDDVLAFIQ